MVKTHKCPNCGANLKQDKITGILKCNNCDSTFTLDKKDVPEEFNFIDAGNKFLKLEEYKKAFESFEQACNISPDNYACWLGLAKSITKNFTVINSSNLKETKKYIANAKKCATDEDIKKLENELKNYYTLFENYTKTQNKEIKNNSYQSIFQVLTLSIFVVLAIVGIVIVFTKANETFIWKLVDTAILLAMNFALYFIISKILPLLKFKEKHQIAISIILFILFIAISVSLNIFALSTI